MSLRIASDRPADQVRHGPGPSVHCPHSGITEDLDGRVVSMHRTSLGVMQYLRCRCGSLVTWSPGGVPKHANTLPRTG